MGMGALCSAAPGITLDDPEGGLSAQKEIDRCLYWAGGLPFEHHSAEMKDATIATLRSIKDIMHKFPALGLHVTCFVGPELSESEASDLSSKRALAVKDVLLDAECANLLHAEGKGCADTIGPRIELKPC